MRYHLTVEGFKKSGRGRGASKIRKTYFVRTLSFRDDRPGYAIQRFSWGDSPEGAVTVSEEAAREIVGYLNSHGYRADCRPAETR